MENNLIAGIGEVLWDIFPEYKQLGGATANFAYHTSQFGFDATVVSALGCDPLGEEIVQTSMPKRLTTCCLVSNIPPVRYTLRSMARESPATTFDRGSLGPHSLYRPEA